jgi:hypothetical protein
LGAAAFDFGVCDRGELIFQSSADITGVGIVIRPPLDAQGLLNLTTSLNASIQIREKPDKAEELVLFGTSGASRLAVQGLGIKWFVAEQQGKLDLGVQAEIQAVRLVIDGNDGDGFLQKVLSGVHVKAEANAALGMTLLTGFTFSGVPNSPLRYLHILRWVRSPSILTTGAGPDVDTSRRRCRLQIWTRSVAGGRAGRRAAHRS